ncbi:somatomedin-B and thrombospondin type-1 domain-containing protein [Anthonomus grandis grandis]|uniref:somatomedin-B and thrombospondin type-1 domain-containing protein n=1 Tax=Anthonomus grandis grandis TaxID=2921223 RepID=UPI002165BA90|nr:somatomedin-B and thrombospondin type-1 domain-containing protein [Anthonomus grandis grandis]
MACTIGKFIVIFLTVQFWCGVVSGGSCGEAKLCCTGRDSSCVVQKAPINAINEDLSDKPCYCDHACLKLGDCCPDFKDACGVVDCQVTPWGPWSSCDADCGPGTMFRSRSIRMQPQNGGRHCPSLEQRRSCEVSTCFHHPDPAIKEIALLLPGALSQTRKTNATSDIRKNLNVRNPSRNPQYDPQKTYCMEFEVLKASKACRKEPDYKTLKEGEKVCIYCESEALHETLGWRCQGHGVEGRVTRWSALSAPHCHGKWLRARGEVDRTCEDRTCKDPDASFIFV